MSRLLFASARGARLQVMADNNWYGATLLYYPFERDARALRIHPKDAHLQYGPISTTLRKMAETPWITNYSDNNIMPPHISMSTEMSSREEALEFALSSSNVKAIFLLILAESVADEGL